MDPITAAIVAALVAGVAKAATPVGENLLKNYMMVSKPSSSAGSASRARSSMPSRRSRPIRDWAGRKEVLKEEIAASKADQDQEIVAAAQQTLDLIKQQPGGGQVIQQATSNYMAQAEGGSTATVQINTRKS